MARLMSTPAATFESTRESKFQMCRRKCAAAQETSHSFTRIPALVMMLRSAGFGCQQAISPLLHPIHRTKHEHPSMAGPAPPAGHHHHHHHFHYPPIVAFRVLRHRPQLREGALFLCEQLVYIREEFFADAHPYPTDSHFVLFDTAKVPPTDVYKRKGEGFGILEDPHGKNAKSMASPPKKVKDTTPQRAEQYRKRDLKVARAAFSDDDDAKTHRKGTIDAPSQGHVSGKNPQKPVYKAQPTEFGILYNLRGLDSEQASFRMILLASRMALNAPVAVSDPIPADVLSCVNVTRRDGKSVLTINPAAVALANHLVSISSQHFVRVFVSLFSEQKKGELSDEQQGAGFVQLEHPFVSHSVIQLFAENSVGLKRLVGIPPEKLISLYSACAKSAPLRRVFDKELIQQYRQY